MKKLQILPGNIANLIAAGEVVQRPASVVKELMENAVDAGAQNISVIVTDAGRTMIKVIDDGCGMSPDDAMLCFERHATSKIATAGDLEAILTYGFRGEALPSISSVAEVTLVTRRQGDELATKVSVTDGGHMATSQTAAPLGTSVSVRNLFFNTPARRKFLKSDNVELKHIVEEFTHIALTRPDLAFTLNHNGRDLYVLKKAKSLEFRISDLTGKGLTSDLVAVSADTSVAGVSGFVGQPSSAKKVAGGQYFFVNGRFFRSPYLHRAVMKAYEDFIPEGLNPSYFIYLKVDPHSLDVNIHPTKTEVKFEEDGVIFQTIYACVKETLGKCAFGAQIDFDTEGALNIPVFGSNFSEFRPSPNPAPDLDPEYNPFDSQSFDEVRPRPEADGGGRYPGSAGQPFPGRPRQDYGALFQEEHPAGYGARAQLLLVQGGKYILAQSASGVMVVNVRRARERILFDRFLQAFSKEGHVTQKALFPVQVQVGTENRLVFDENAGMLQDLGFDISPFGTDTVVVNGVPEGYSCEPGKVQAMVLDIIRLLSLDDRQALPEMMAVSVAQKFAFLGASGADGLTNTTEAQELLGTLLSCQNAEFTSGGHRVISLLGSDELEKLFR